MVSNTSSPTTGSPSATHGRSSAQWCPTPSTSTGMVSGSGMRGYRGWKLCYLSCVPPCSWTMGAHGCCRMWQVVAVQVAGRHRPALEFAGWLGFAKMVGQIWHWLDID
eukprot:1008301-Pelagomonas_calceolata.AAC.13